MRLNITKKITGIILVAAFMVGTAGNVFASKTFWECNGCTSAIDYIEKEKAQNMPMGPHRLSTLFNDYNYDSYCAVARTLLSEDFLKTGVMSENGLVNADQFIEREYALCDNQWKARRRLRAEDGNYYYYLPENQKDIDELAESIRQQRFMEEWVRNRVAGMPPTLDSVKDLFQEIAMNTEYDFSNKQFSAYDVVVNHISTCNGYARLFDAELEALGIESYFIEGKFDKDIESLFYADHAWNGFILDGKIYACDITQAIRFRNERDIFDFFGEDPTMMMAFIRDEIGADYDISNLW